MAIVVDASLMVRLASEGEYAEQIAAKLEAWAGAGVELHAPGLLPYELESGIRSLVFAKRLTEIEALRGLQRVADVPITLHPHPGHGRILKVAGRQGTKAAYDAAYLDLAQVLGAELWTADRRLRHHGEALNIPVRIISEDVHPPAKPTRER